MNADEIIQKMVAKYGTCRSYQDSGSVEGSQGQMTFRTYFARPERFRFEWTYIKPPELGRSMIRCDGSRAFSFDDRSNAEALEDDISGVIAGATGVSQGVAHTVPTLLMPELRASRESRTLPKLAPYAIQGHEKVGATSTVHLVSARGNERTEIWVDSDSFAIVKYSEWRRSTPESDQELLDALAECLPESVEELRESMANRTEEQRESLTTVAYERAIFDDKIPESRFNELA